MGQTNATGADGADQGLHDEPVPGDRMQADPDEAARARAATQVRRTLVLGGAAAAALLAVSLAVNIL